jgi:hypothetical protein
VATILKMATGTNFSMSGINSGHHYLPTYQILMISDNVEFCGIVAAILKMGNSVFSKFSRCLPLSKWLPKHGIKMGGKNSTMSDIIKI